MLIFKGLVVWNTLGLVTFLGLYCPGAFWGFPTKENAKLLHPPFLYH